MVIRKLKCKEISHYIIHFYTKHGTHDKQLHILESLLLAAKYWRKTKLMKLSIILFTSKSIAIDGDHHYGATIHFLSKRIDLTKNNLCGL